MTIGISKEYLESIINEEKYGGLLSKLISKCTELDPWIPIDGNTPRDKPLLLFVKYPKYIIEGSYNKDYEEWHDITFAPIKPTHYKLLPEDPK